jgi:hypothetical protein
MGNIFSIHPSGSFLIERFITPKFGKAESNLFDGGEFFTNLWAVKNMRLASSICLIGLVRVS